MGFAAGFKVGWDSVSDGMRERERREMLDGVKAAMEARAEQSTGYTAAQGTELENAAKAGSAVTFDQAQNAYVVTPADGGAARTMPMQGVTDFMGKRTAGTMDDAQVRMARNLAVAGVMGKYDPVRGMQMEQQALSNQRDDQRFGQEQKQWQRQDDEQKRDVEYRTGRERLLQSSAMGQAQAASAKFEQDTAAYNAAVKAGKSPEELGPPPQKPNIQRPGPMQTLSGYADLIAHDYKYGKLNTDGLINFQEKMQTLEKENYTKALQVAQGGGTPEQIAKAFNSAGMQIEPKNITISRTKQANGPEQVTLNYKDDRGQESSINVIAELDAYGKAKDVFDRFYQGEQNRRGNEQLQLSKNADGRAGAAVMRDQTEKIEKANAALALFQQRNPNATAAELEAVRKGVIDINPDTKNAPSEVKLAQAMVDAGLASDMRSGLEMAITKKSQDPSEMHKGFVELGIKNLAKPEEAVSSADKVMESMGYTKGNGRWSLPNGKAAGKDAGGMASDPKAIAIRDDKKLTLEQKRAKLKELGYQ